MGNNALPNVTRPFFRIAVSAMMRVHAAGVGLEQNALLLHVDLRYANNGVSKRGPFWLLPEIKKCGGNESHRL
jgi:hypothetical protein